jgi:hypothetical protein
LKEQRRKWYELNYPDREYASIKVTCNPVSTNGEPRSPKPENSKDGDRKGEK